MRDADQEDTVKTARLRSAFVPFTPQIGDPVRNTALLACSGTQPGR
jgi:hypothetical protein